MPSGLFETWPHSVRLLLMLAVVAFLLMVPFEPPDFTAHGCRFFYVGDRYGYPLPYPVAGMSLEGYVIELGSGMTMEGQVNMDTGEHRVRCYYE